jgi:hypothetical protein
MKDKIEALLYRDVTGGTIATISAALVSLIIIGVTL